MHKQRNRLIFFGTAAAAGAASLMLHRYMMDNCFDDKGLLMAGNLPGRLLIALGVGFALFLLVMLRTIGGEGEYEDNFPACRLSGGLMAAAGVAMLWAVPGLELTGGGEFIRTGIPALVGHAVAWASVFLPWAAAGAMVVLGIYRMAGKRPSFLFGSAVCLFYMVVLVNNYRLWSADPQVYDYAYPFLAMVLLMLCSFHRTCCDADVIQRRRLLFTGLTAAMCCVAALSGEFLKPFYLASGLWAAGCVCDVSVLPPDPEPEPEEVPAEPEE